MAKSNQLTINGEKATIRRTPIGNYDMVFSFREIPVGEAYLNDLANRLVVWADTNEKALKLNLFLRENKISQDAFYTWVKRSESLAAAHKYALNCIGDRREIGVITRKFEPSAIVRSMPLYDNAWKELSEWQAKMKDDSAAHGNITVKMDPIPTIEEKK